MVMDGHRIVDVNGVDLCVDTIGDAADPAILLISGMGGSMDWWEEEFCQRLAAGGRLVIRYDHRDTGRAVSYPAGAPGYTGADLAADVAGVLDALGRRSAHLAGISMGGALAQQVALAHPDRGASQVLRGLRHGRSASILSAGGTVAALRSRARAEGAAAAWILMGRLHYGGEGRPLLRGEGQLRPTLVLRVADGDHGACSGHFDAVAVAEAVGGLAPANAG